MQDVQVQETAKQLLAQVEDVLLDVQPLAWPWQPYREDCADESKERECRRIVNALDVAMKTEAKTEEEKKAKEETTIALAADLVRLGGYILDQGALEVARGNFYLYDQYNKLEKFGGLGKFEEDFDELLPWWDDCQPDWQRLKKELVDLKLVNLIELPQLTLVDIWRALDHLATPVVATSVSGSPDGGDKHEPASLNRWAFDGADWHISFGENVGVVRDGDGCHYYHYILKRPNEQVSSEWLYQLCHSNSVTPLPPSGPADKQFDKETEANLNRELNRLNDDLDIAKSTGNEPRASEIQEKINQIALDYIAKGKNQYGRTRAIASPDREKRHDSVRKALKRTHRLLEKKKLTRLACHLRDTVTAQNFGWIYKPAHDFNWES